MKDLSAMYEFGSTRWSLVLQARQKEGDKAAAARNQLLVRYHEAVYRYLLARLNNAEVAADLFSRFAERVLEIHPFLQRADPEKGRFRDYLKRILRNLVIDHFREQQREKRKRRELPQDLADPETAEEAGGEDEEFAKVWCEELMNHAWKALAQVEKSKGTPVHTVLLFKAQNPTVRSEAISQQLSPVVGKTLTAVNVRQLVHRGQELLSDLLVREVARSLQVAPDEVVAADRVEEELINLGLFDKQRREALERYRQSKPLPG